MTDEEDFTELENILRQLVAVAMVSQADYARLYKQAERYVATRKGDRQLIDGTYDLRRAAGAFLRLAGEFWPGWPSQNMAPGEVCGGASARRGGPSSVAPGRGGSDDY